MIATQEIDTFNKFMVAAQGDHLTLLNPPMPGQRFTRNEALILAAYLVSMADPGSVRFHQILEAVQNA
jgi:hypothetical protein